MSKFNNPQARPAVTSVIKTEAAPRGRTHQGGPGHARDAKSELFLLAVANMVGEDTFYESGRSRDDRFVKLVHTVTAQDPNWMASFIQWLRNDGNMRSASIVAAAEMARYFQQNADTKVVKEALWVSQNLQQPSPVRWGINGALRRADEPGELLAYWTSKYGRSLPKALKRGVADAVSRLYDEYTFLKYDRGAFRFGDVLELVHPEAKDNVQGALFKHALDMRHGRDVETEDLFRVGLEKLHSNHVLRFLVSQGKTTDLYDPESLKAAGMTWEDVLSLGGQRNLDKRRLWEAMIPNMGIMALIRNLRNFDEAGVSDKVAAQVIAKLQDPQVIAKSRQFPFRFLSAYNAAPSLRWGYALERALDASLSNVPALKGRTLILVDQSGSMFHAVSGKSTMQQNDMAAIFGTALALRSGKGSSLVQYGTSSQEVPVVASEGLLKSIKRFHGMGGTDTAGAVQRHYAKHDRVVIVTDEQVGNFGHGLWGGSYGNPADHIPANVPLYTWNLVGYSKGHGPSGEGNRHTFGGMNDAAFKMIDLMERGKNGVWPWETASE
jgi:hypothetical protein